MKFITRALLALSVCALNQPVYAVDSVEPGIVALLMGGTAVVTAVITGVVMWPKKQVHSLESLQARAELARKNLDSAIPSPTEFLTVPGKASAQLETLVRYEKEIASILADSTDAQTIEKCPSYERHKLITLRHTLEQNRSSSQKKRTELEQMMPLINLQVHCNNVQPVDSQNVIDPIKAIKSIKSERDRLSHLLNQAKKIDHPAVKEAARVAEERLTQLKQAQLAIERSSAYTQQLEYKEISAREKKAAAQLLAEQNNSWQIQQRISNAESRATSAEGFAQQARRAKEAAVLEQQRLEKELEKKRRSQKYYEYFIKKVASDRADAAKEFDVLEKEIKNPSQNPETPEWRKHLGTLVDKTRTASIRTCQVCLEEITSDSFVTHCNQGSSTATHEYHKACIKRVLLHASGALKCPDCRGDVENKSDL